MSTRARMDEPASRSLVRFSVLFCGSLLLLALPPCTLAAQAGPASSTQADSDGDGLSDALEQALLVQFAPAFMVSPQDCSRVPASFEPNVVEPRLKAEDGTIYGQVFPAKGSTAKQPMVELHFFHLWRSDCGAHGHPLDTEHVAALVRASGSLSESDPAGATWKVVYWYAAAHENTVCDVSQITRASTLEAESSGATVWISAGKHASYLNQSLCQGGCGSDQCGGEKPLHVSRLINLGEPGHPMNGSLFTASARWPLAGKMEMTNFPENPVARLEALPATDIAWFNPGRHPAQGVIAISSSTGGALLGSEANTADALSLASDQTGSAMSSAGSSTGDALETSSRKTLHALRSSARHVGNALHVRRKKAPEE